MSDTNAPPIYHPRVGAQRHRVFRRNVYVNTAPVKEKTLYGPLGSIEGDVVIVTRIDPFGIEFSPHHATFPYSGPNMHGVRVPPFHAGPPVPLLGSSGAGRTQVVASVDEAAKAGAGEREIADVFLRNWNKSMEKLLSPGWRHIGVSELFSGLLDMSRAIAFFKFGILEIALAAGEEPFTVASLRSDAAGDLFARVGTRQLNKEMREFLNVFDDSVVGKSGDDGEDGMSALTDALRRTSLSTKIFVYDKAIAKTPFARDYFALIGSSALDITIDMLKFLDFAAPVRANAEAARDKTISSLRSFRNKSLIIHPRLHVLIGARVLAKFLQARGVETRRLTRAFEGERFDAEFERLYKTDSVQTLQKQLILRSSIEEFVRREYAKNGGDLDAIGDMIFGKYTIAQQEDDDREADDEDRDQ